MKRTFELTEDDIKTAIALHVSAVHGVQVSKTRLLARERRDPFDEPTGAYEVTARVWEE